MKHVDALSRYAVMMIVDDTITARLKKAQLEDENICSLKQLLNSNESQEYLTRNEILYKFVGGRELIIAPSDIIISDRGSAFTSKAFNDYCTEEGIQHLQIATGVPRGNGQIERIHRTLIPVLKKLSLEDPTKWYRYVDKLQRILNSTTNRSTKWTSFELLTGVKMKNKEDIKIISLLEEEINEEFQFQRSRIRQEEKKKPLNITLVIW
ncbi:reverse transcriptase [Caerostris darwini]|uniref:Reverse transcriptase n=1 Tax=Caerostris darwini TaxID=1538125 RepID=A0AAV4QW34_9ARAC|nr:reverse transcriptase [Caerostris darwini]